MKMNITFCVSSIPNQRMVSGISAATGRLRPNSASGAPAASTTRHEPARMPSGTPTSDREAEADQHALQRRRDALQQRALVAAGWESCANTSRGLGRITGEISRSSGAGAARRQPPEQHDDAHRPDADQAARHRAAAGGEASSSDGRESTAIYLAAAVASAG